MVQIPRSSNLSRYTPRISGHATPKKSDTLKAKRLLPSTQMTPAFRRENRLSDVISEEEINGLESFQQLPGKSLNCSGTKCDTAISQGSHQAELIMGRWRVYIGQANSSQEKFYRIERLTRAYRESDETLDLFARNKFFSQAWIKYAERVADTEDVFEFILDKQIGFCFYSTYKTIAEYFETIRDYRRADKVYRDGFALLAQSDRFERETKTLDFHYEKFAKRVAEVYHSGIKPALKSLKVQSRGFNQRFCNFKVDNPLRPFEEQKEVARVNEQYLDGDKLTQRKSFTKNQVILGGVPIYVDIDVRDKVIPKGTQEVEWLYSGLKEIDQYESIRNSKDNFVVREAKQARELERSKQLDKPPSWLEQQPQLKASFKFKPLDLSGKNVRKTMFRAEDYQTQQDDYNSSTNLFTSLKRLSIQPSPQQTPFHNQMKQRSIPKLTTVSEQSPFSQYTQYSTNAF